MDDDVVEGGIGGGTGAVGAPELVDDEAEALAVVVLLAVEVVKAWPEGWCDKG